MKESDVMNEIKKLYEAWCKEKTSDNLEVREKWCEILEYLYEHCSESDREELSTSILDFSNLAEQEAFTAGFQQAFRLWLDVL